MKRSIVNSFGKFFILAIFVYLICCGPLPTENESNVEVKTGVSIYTPINGAKVKLYDLNNLLESSSF